MKGVCTKHSHLRRGRKVGSAAAKWLIGLWGGEEGGEEKRLTDSAALERGSFEWMDGCCIVDAECVCELLRWMGKGRKKGEGGLLTRHGANRVRPGVGPG